MRCAYAAIELTYLEENMRRRSYWELQRRWRRQFGGRASRRPRDAGAIGFLVSGGQPTGLVELHKVTAVVVYDQPRGRGRSVTQLVGVGPIPCEHGVDWGGEGNVRIAKNLSLAPRPGARGSRIDARRTRLFELALRLDHRIDQAMRLQPSGHTRQFRLPQAWAGYTDSDAMNLYGEGPEFEEACRWYGTSAQRTFESFRRSQAGLALYPLEWVSSQLADAVGMFMEMSGMPRRQAFQVGGRADGLAGQQGAMSYDFRLGQRADICRRADRSSNKLVGCV
jgi:hypothetical protein